MFAVVIFPDNSTEVVPNSWLRGDTQCRWPPQNSMKTAAFSKAVSTGVPPSPDWDTYDIKILAKTESLEKARKKCLKAVRYNTSDVATTDADLESTSKRKKHLPARYRLSSSSSSEDDNEQPQESMTDNAALHAQKKKTIDSVPLTLPAVPPMTPQRNTSLQRENNFGRPPKKRLCRPSPSLPSVSPVMHRKASSSSTSIGIDDSPLSDSQSSMSVNDGAGEDTISLMIDAPAKPKQDSSERDKALMSMMERIWGQVRQNTIMLRTLINRQQLENQSEASMDEFNLPLACQTDVDRVERLLSDKAYYKTMVNHLISLGGCGAKDTITRMLSALLTNSLACTYNWQGKGTKTGLSKLKLIQAIKSAGKKTALTECAIEEVIKRWLKNAGDREGGRKKRIEKKIAAEKMAKLKEAVDSSSESD